MKKHTLIAVALLVVTIGFFGYTQLAKPALDGRTQAVTVPTNITSDAFPLAFSYPSGPDGLAMIEPPVSTSSASGLKKVYLLMNTQQYVDFSKAEAGTMPPPTISIFAFAFGTSTVVESAEQVDQSRVSKLQNWAISNPQYSSWAASVSVPAVVELDGVTAIVYQTESVYKQDVYLALYQGDLYLLTGQYQEESDEMRTIFTELIASLSFD